MLTLKKAIDYINRHIGPTKQKAFVIEIRVDPAAINREKVKFLYYFLNTYENLYFISIEGLAYCLMPDAEDHLVYHKNPTGTYKKLEICAQCKHLPECPGWDIAALSNRNILNPPIDIPNEIVFEATTTCNLNCKTCAIDKSKPENIDLKTAKEIMWEAKKLGIKAVRFTGGDPLLHPEIGKLLLYAKTNNFYVLLNTNATILTRSLLKIIGGTVNNVLISLQGYDQDSDNSLTCSKADFQAKIKNILTLKSAVPAIRAGTVISKTLLRHFTEYRRLLSRMDIRTWELYRPINQHRSKEFHITKRNLLKITREVLKLKECGINAKIANPVPFCICSDTATGASTILGALADDGNSRIVWDVKGYFKPSYFIDKNLGKDLAKAWHHPFLKRLKKNTYLPSSCRSCNYLKWCKGGSRVMAKINSGRYFSTDPLLTGGNEAT